MDSSAKRVYVNGGPVRSWWITGYSKDEEAVVGVTTDFADYYLVSPSSIYYSTMEPFLKQVSFPYLPNTVNVFLFGPFHMVLV